MRIRQLTIQRYRGIDQLQFQPGLRTVLIGPNNSGKSTVLEALDLLLHPGFGRPRPMPQEVDYFRREPASGFEIEAVVGDLPESFRAETHRHLEGWKEDAYEVIPEPDGSGIEPIVRVRVRGTPEYELIHEFAKPESEGTRFTAPLRLQIGWVFDGRTRDPSRQLAFYQGGLLDRMFAGSDLDAALEALKGALAHGADSVNQDAAVEQVLTALATDLSELGLLDRTQAPSFEIGAVSKRDLLQTLRLALPLSGEIRIPLAFQGRGAQRLVLVSALLRLARSSGRQIIGGFEEPEEALEPLRQAQMSDMLVKLADDGGQVFVVTHSPEIVRAFHIEDLVLLSERTAGAGARVLRRDLSPATRQSYERWLDGPVVRGLFARVPVLVEGPSDRAVLEVFWREMVRLGLLRPAAQIGLDLVNCEGVCNMPMLATVLDEAGKSVVVLCDQDSDDAIGEVQRLRDGNHCRVLILHDAATRQNLERSLVSDSPVDALAAAMTAIASDRGYTWEDQRTDLMSRCEGLDPQDRERAKSSDSLPEFFSAIGEENTKELAAKTLGCKGVTPFEMKGGRQARILAETLIAAHGVPANYSAALKSLQDWIDAGCSGTTEITLTRGIPSARS